MELKNNNTGQKRIAFYTLGCKLNFAETASIFRQMTDKGYRKVAFSDEADYYVINTCSVTQTADKKCRNAIKKAVSNGGKIIVMGCYSQLKPDEIAKIEGVDLILGTKEKYKLADYIEELDRNENRMIRTCDVHSIDQFDGAFSTTDRTRAFLKIQDGCDYYCSYCTVPLARGKSRNEDIKAILKKADIIAQQGIKEIVITGVNIGDFGKSTGENFFNLIKELDQVEGIERFRISSVEPNLLTDEIIEFIAHSKKIVPHFHIPLQSGNNKILGLMGRRYKRELFEQRVIKIHNILPDACIGVDVIVGFPGESDDDFNDTYQLLQKLNISYLHVFPFSERPNTRAIDLSDKVSATEKAKRTRSLIALSQEKRNLFYKKNLGKEVDVLFELNITKGKIVGFSNNYIKAETQVEKDVIGKIKRVKLESILNNGNVGSTLIN